MFAAALNCPAVDYPSQQSAWWQLADGRRVLLRPLLPQDQALFGAWIAGLSPLARRCRFLGACSGVTGQRLVDMTTTDPSRDAAFVLVYPQNGADTLIGEARYALGASGRSAEFAVMVDPAWQGLGLGARAMHTLLACASKQGVRRLHASVLADNWAMRVLAQHCGFYVAPHPLGDELVYAEIDVPSEMHTLPLPATGRVSWLRGLLDRSLRQRAPKTVTANHHTGATTCTNTCTA
jgi:acetyltransferase